MIIRYTAPAGVVTVRYGRAEMLVSDDGTIDLPRHMRDALETAARCPIRASEKLAAIPKCWSRTRAGISGARSRLAIWFKSKSPSLRIGE